MIHRIKRALKTNAPQAEATAMFTLLNVVAYLSGARTFSWTVLVAVVLFWPALAFVFGLFDPIPTNDKKTQCLDFEHKCCFRHQIEHIGEGIKNGTGEIVYIQMESGKTAKYRLTSESCGGITADPTGQKDWHFTFLEYDEG